MKGRFILATVAACFCMYAYADCPPGDINKDCTVDAADLRVLAQSWLGDANSPANLNHDALVNQADLAVVAATWGQTGCPIVVNEVLAHAHADAPDWIELYNTSNTRVDISGWMLSDREDELDRFTIARGTVVGPFEYIVFYENTHFGNALNPGTRTPFALTENGETLYLYSGQDPVFPGYLVEAPLGPSETFNSFVRYQTSIGTYHYVTTSEPTPGEANAYPRVGPVIINEVMYHPADDADAEYVELLNIDEGPVTLFDFAVMEPWRLIDRDSGIDFRFPTDAPVTLQKGEHLLLVKELVTARRWYKIPTGTKVIEWDSGKLANQGEHLFLLKPGDVDIAGNRYWIEVDSLEYSDGSRPDDFPKKADPWPKAADGDGPSLNRLFPRKYGNDPNNWQATIPTPGSAND